MIHFFSEDSDFLPDNPDQVKHWLHAVAIREGNRIDEINYIFCSDDYLHQMNMEYLNHDTLTDILTFDNRDDLAEELSGDIFISIDRVLDNARDHGVSLDQELHRVMVHGLLHLLGFRDHTAEEKMLMRKKEDACLSLRES